MQKKNFLYIGIGIAIVAIIIPLSMLNSENIPLAENTETIPEAENISEFEISYDSANSNLKQKLETQGVYMSSPVNLINKNSINQYCTFFTDDLKQSLVEYCSSTEILDSEGQFVGNIHLVGSRNMPKIILVIAQTNPFMENLDQIKLVFDVAIDEMVCNCWEDFEPSDIQTVSDWVDKQRDFHLSDVRPTSTSSLVLEGKNLQLELSTNNEGYLWKLLISG